MENLIRPGHAHDNKGLSFLVKKEEDEHDPIPSEYRLIPSTRCRFLALQNWLEILAGFISSTQRWVGPSAKPEPKLRLSCGTARFVFLELGSNRQTDGSSP